MTRWRLAAASVTLFALVMLAHDAWPHTATRATPTAITAPDAIDRYLARHRAGCV